MADTEVDTLEVHPITFPPQVLARIAPDLSLQRHLSLGIRPCLRKFEEFRDIHINQGTLSRYNINSDDQSATSNSILGSNVLKCGSTFVITSITGGIVEETVPLKSDDIGEEELLQMTERRDEIAKYATVSPLVEVERGRVGAPTDEEMTLSQKLHDSILHAGIIPKTALDVKCGVRLTDKEGKVKIVYPEDNADDVAVSHVQQQKKWSYVLYAKIVVFSRTGPVFDLCWNSLIYALKDTKLPRAFIDERATDFKMTVRTRGRSATIRETYDVKCDPQAWVPLNLVESKIGYASSFGIIDLDPEAQLNDDEDEDMELPQSILLADVDTEAEESCIQTTISVIGDSSGNLNSVSLVGGGARITPEAIKRALALSKKRSADLSTKTNIE